MTEPVPPRDVRLSLPDGEVISLEVVYVGPDADGVHQWRAVIPVSRAGLLAGARLEVGTLPARTAIGVGLVD